MTILDKVREYYQANFSHLNLFLEETSFLDTTPKYPNSVVIKFGINKIVGEVSVWQHDNESYMEFEFVDLIRLDDDPVNRYKKVDDESVIVELTRQFDELRKL